MLNTSPILLFQQQSKEHQRPPVSTQSTEWLCSWLFTFWLENTHKRKKVFLSNHIYHYHRQAQSNWLFTKGIWPPSSFFLLELAFFCVLFWTSKLKSPMTEAPYLSDYHKTYFLTTSILQASFPIHWDSIKTCYRNNYLCQTFAFPLENWRNNLASNSRIVSQAKYLRNVLIKKWLLSHKQSSQL